MRITALLKPLLLAVSLLPLSACGSLFDSRPKTMTIEYDEEVKLHDGEMIWVHITRHYFLTGGALGDSATLSSNYLPSDVEISWDTGFEGVGRKSVFFGKYVGIIDKYDGKWYVGGAKSNVIKDIGISKSCDKYGAIVESYKCVVAINKDGFLTQDLTKNSFLR